MDKVVIVTGGARGIGKAIVLALAEVGYKVVLNYNKSEKEAIEIKELLTKKEQIVEIYKADVSKKEEVRGLVEFTIERFGRIDVLVNNAGVYNFNLIQDIEEEEWDEIIDTNLKSVFLCSQAVIKDMLKK